jgi:plasmid stabilization system protein ParE
MTYLVVVQPRAERDIQFAAHWILGQSRSPATAMRWARKLRAKIASLKTNPQRCPIDPDSEIYGEEVRVLLHGKRSGVYRVLFLIRRGTVHVLTVRHSAQRSLSDEMADDEPDE